MRPSLLAGAMVVAVVAFACVLQQVVELGLLMVCRRSLLRVVLVTGWVAEMVLSHRRKWWMVNG